jgi:hypothetical protein
MNIKVACISAASFPFNIFTDRAKPRKGQASWNLMKKCQIPTIVINALVKGLKGHAHKTLCKIIALNYSLDQN